MRGLVHGMLAQTELIYFDVFKHIHVTYVHTKIRIPFFCYYRVFFQHYSIVVAHILDPRRMAPYLDASPSNLFPFAHSYKPQPFLPIHHTFIRSPHVPSPCLSLFLSLTLTHSASHSFPFTR